VFRRDLYYRLSLFQIHIPPLRERRSDIPLMANYFLRCLNATLGVVRRFSAAAVENLTEQSWPGNVRELRATVERWFVESDSPVISPLKAMDVAASTLQSNYQHTSDGPSTGVCGLSMMQNLSNFWRDVYQPFLRRDLNREEVREIVRLGLERSSGSYRVFLARSGVSHADYLKAMDFLRHHSLKPPEYKRRRGQNEESSARLGI
jgi:DNA-binding NtrC family response regulator